MPDWDAESSELHENLALVLLEVTRTATRREHWTLDTAREWHCASMRGLIVPDASYLGAFRGEPELERLEAQVLSKFGVPAVAVARELAGFEGRLRALVAKLDVLFPTERVHDRDQVATVIDACAWVHAEWVRIHPFVNGNGRVARIWVNAMAVRYGLPPFLQLRPRPNAGYAEAGAKAMSGDWHTTASVLWDLLRVFLEAKIHQE